MAVNRLMYNDHGPVHSKIVSGVALEILKDYVTPSIVKDKIGELIDSKIVVLCGSYLHDIGNAVHRELHHFECKNCGFKEDRDCIAVANIAKKFLMKLWETRLGLLLGFGMNKDQSLGEEGLGTQPKTFLQAK